MGGTPSMNHTKARCGEARGIRGSIEAAAEAAHDRSARNG